MNRRWFLNWLGMATGALVTTGSVTVQRGAQYLESDPIDCEKLDSEVLEVCVYGGQTVHDRHLLRRQKIRARGEKRTGRVDYYSTEEWSIVLDGPIAVSAVTCSTPRALQWIQKEVTLPIHPFRAEETDETITILMPERLLSIS